MPRATPKHDAEFRFMDADGAPATSLLFRAGHGIGDRCSCPRYGSREQRIEGGLDALDGRGFVREWTVRVVDEHRGVYLEDNDPSIRSKRAIDAKEIEVDRCAYRM
jgi:hypothetical protein